MIKTYQAAPDVDVLTGDIPIPGIGVVPVNAFVLQGREPVLVDTGAVCHRDAFLETLRSVVDPKSLKWIWLTHPDPDHIGALYSLLDENPHCRVITTFLGAGILGLSNPVPMDRVYLLNPGEEMRLGDRTVVAVKPPTFDNPSTTGLFIRESRTLLSSDCFGAVLAEPPDSAEDLTAEELRIGQVLWTSIDSPWLHHVDRGAYARELERVRAFEPDLVLSSHLPAASGKTLPRMLAALQDVPDAERFVGPDQPALEQMLAQMSAAQ